MTATNAPDETTAIQTTGVPKPTIADFPQRLEELRHNAQEYAIWIHDNLEALSEIMPVDYDGDEINGLYNIANQLQSTALEAAKMAKFATSLALKTREQRDELAVKLKDIHSAMENPWMTKHPAVNRLYHELVETHNAAFWESLPYDIAATLGWDHWEGDDIYRALTYDPYAEEFDPDAPIDEINEVMMANDGYTFTELQQFRAGVRQLLHQLMHRSPNYQKD